MSVFSPTPEFRAASAQERMAIAVDTPFTFGRTLSENFQQGILDSFGLGTTIREGMTPQGNTPRYEEGIIPNPMERLGSLAQTIGGYIRGDQPEPSLSADEYKSSPYYREAIPWEPGMTQSRAAAMAAFWDLKTVRAHFSQKQPVAMFAGQLIGQALDPINYIPMFGQAASAAMVARFGSVLGRAMVAAGDASLNTAIASLATRGIREQFGDDVSWQSTAMDIAMSAVIGGVFGGVVGTVARGADARARIEEQRAAILSDTARNAQESLIPLNEAIDGIVSRGEVSLSPNGMAPIERVRQEVATRVEGPQALRTETAAVTGDRIGDVVITPAGTRVNVRPEVVDLSTLVQAAGALQVRNRNSAASAAQIEDIALNLDPARLMPAVSADQGAPIVGPDNVVDSGNGRVQAIKRAAEAYPERYAAYRKAIEAAGYSTEGMQTPVLVQRRTTNLSEPARAQFNAEANNSAIARMNAVELANMDRTAMMQPGVLDLHVPGELTSAANRPFVDRFLAEIGQNERAALVDESGTSLSADGVRRVENALVAAAYGDIDPTVIRRFAEATDSNTRTIVGAMSDAAPRWALMRRAVKAGEISPEFDMTTELTDALRLVANWRDQAAREGRAVSTVIREGLGQFDIFKGEIAPEAQVFVRMFYRNDHFGMATGREALAGRFDKIVSSAFDLGQPQLFGSEVARAPEPEPGMIRYYHGTTFTSADGAFGRTFLTPSETYARDYRGGPNNVLYTDFTKAEAIQLGLYDEINGHPQNGSITDAASRLKPLETSLSVTKMEMLRNATDDLETNLFAPDRVEPGAQERGAGGERYSPGATGVSDRQAVGQDAGGGSQPRQVGFRSAAEADAAELMRMAEAGDIEGIKASPALERITARMNEQPRTDLVAGYGTEAWGRSRIYKGEDGRQIVGVDAAHDYLVENARTLAAKELGIEPFAIATERKAVIVIGPPAAGKSTIANEVARKMRAAIPDPDEAKKIMPEYGDGIGSNATHEESSMLSGFALRTLAQNGDNMVIPKVGGSTKSIEGLASKLKSEGYTVDLMLMDVPPAEAFRRMVGRFVRTGRLIPPRYFDEVSTVPAKVYDEIKMKGTMDGYARIASERGAAPRVSESSLRTADFPAGSEIAVGNGAGQRGQDAGGMGRGGQAPRQAEQLTDALPPPEPVPEGLDLAAARVGKPDSMRDLAEQHGVDLTTGDYAESFDVEQMRQQGRLTTEDEALLKAADEEFVAAESYGNAIKAAVACIV